MFTTTTPEAIDDFEAELDAAPSGEVEGTLDRLLDEQDLALAAHLAAESLRRGASWS